MLLNKFRNHLESLSGTSFDSSKQIRVLILDAGEAPIDISANLQFVTLHPRKWPRPEEQIEWEAISYCWGDPKPFCTITLDGYERTVTENVFNVLCELRLPTKKRVLWIDYLCINQEDSKEKELQVPMMRSIYLKAASVIAWICPAPNEASEAVFAAARWLEKGLDKSTLSKTEPLLTCFRQQSAVGYCERPFQQFLSLPWFQRIWVVQEAVVARDLSVHLGGQVLSWELFSSTIFRFMSYLEAQEAVESSLSKCFAIAREKGYDSQEESQVGLTMVNLIADLRKWYLNPKIPIVPSMLVSMCKDRRATVPADMIYAISGFFDWPPRKNKQPTFSVNYKISTAEVYMRFTIWCIEREKNLDILAQQRYENGYRWEWPELPTWTPDWSSLRLNDFNIAERRSISTKRPLALLSPHIPKFRREGDKLILRGFIIDTIGSERWNEENWLQRTLSNKKCNFLLFGAETPTAATLEQYRARTTDKDARISHLWREGETLDEEQATMRWHTELRTDHGLLAFTFPYFQDDPPAKICCFLGARSLFVVQEKQMDERSGVMLHTIVAGHCFIDGFENGKGIVMAKKMGLKEVDICLV